VLTDRRPGLAAAVGGVAVAGWVVLLGRHHAGLPLLVGWTVMVLAMMLPPAWPFLRMVGALGRGSVSFAAVGFVLPWVLTGAVLCAAQLALPRPDSPLLRSVLLLVAGGYQFSAVKTRCLTACRSPAAFAARWWRSRWSPPVESALLGGAYGVSCVGCCWALMGLTFGAGLMSPAAMLLLAGVTAAERLLPSGVRLAAPVGATLILLALLPYAYG
jgi:predicted metal-binding membrane protein